MTTSVSDPNGSELSPAQSVLRFAAEIAALACWASIGWQIADGVGRWLLAFALPLIAAAAWGTFRVPDDRSANGAAPVPVPGVVRLFIEIDVLIGAAVVTILLGNPVVGAALAVAVVAHYGMTTERVRWLLSQHPDRR